MRLPAERWPELPAGGTLCRLGGVDDQSTPCLCLWTTEKAVQCSAAAVTAASEQHAGLMPAGFRHWCSVLMMMMGIASRQALSVTLMSYCVSIYAILAWPSQS